MRHARADSFFFFFFAAFTQRSHSGDDPEVETAIFSALCRDRKGGGLRIVGDFPSVFWPATPATKTLEHYEEHEIQSKVIRIPPW